MTRMRAFVTDGKGSGSVQSVPCPSPRGGEILVKIHYAALNPGDWKLVEGDVLDGPAQPGLIAGCDFAGTVEDANGSDWQKGQRVGGWVHGATFEGIGSFAEYMNIEASLVFAVPDNITLQQASTISLAFATATQAMYQHLSLPEPYQSKEDRVDFLVYGASTSVGLYALQLGKLSGLRVIAVASSKNHDLLKRLGAEVTVDYHDEDWVERVKEITGGKLRYALDNITDGGSPEKVARCLAQSAGSQLIALSPLDKESLHAVNPYLKAESMLAFTVFGRALGEEYTVFDNTGPETPDEKSAWEKYLRLVTEMLERGDLEANPVIEVGTLEDVTDAFRLSREGQLSAEKAVLRVNAELGRDG
ncbi:chaperonin 10-like protein [Fusarium sp. MPI-SDFR-AT-0072]|uniref:Trans-enoyl reductase ACTTS2 n=1 Tax=Fusarium oxysporum f. sp. rapae TaxID=485398 RepID=A0A8J5NJZ1_FUSOX|nr:Trans-enoyl reductase ACTTS2 [Fusarium oxysporum f. sp. rapae]KAH7147814.1 chaperonin 10-like protein [Fusarium sp. MPI-SDFR-AT-0072]